MAETPSKTKLIYSIIDRSAMKIVTLIKIANLDYIIQQTHDDNAWPHVLKTQSGELYKQYEIIAYIVAQSKYYHELQLSNFPEEEVKSSDQSEVESQNLEDIQPQVQNRTVINLAGQDVFMTVKMQEKLYQLRENLFPLLNEFYKYLTGYEKTKKGKYDSLMSKIKKQIGKLDADINEHPQLYHREFNFLNIIIACEIFMAYKFVFEEKFRKSKYSLLNKYQKITNRKEFIEVHGKSDFCLKEYVPSEFEEETGEEKEKEKKNNDKKMVISNNQVIKISQKFASYPVGGDSSNDTNRNQLLYNYFRHVFGQFQLESNINANNKRQYYPYFWLMFDQLNCSLVQIVLECQEEDTEEASILRMKNLHGKMFSELNTEVDYGILGLYRNATKTKDQNRNNDLTSLKDKQGASQIDTNKQQNLGSSISLPNNSKQFIIRGLICLGSKPYEQFEANIQSPSRHLMQSAATASMNNMQYPLDDKNAPKLHKIDPNCQKERNQVEIIWENMLTRKTEDKQEENKGEEKQGESTIMGNIRLCMIMNF